MSKQKAAPKATPSNAKTPLLIFAALGALFGSGAIIGVTVLSSPALGWRMFTARLVSYLICYGILFFAISRHDAFDISIIHRILQIRIFWMRTPQRPVNCDGHMMTDSHRRIGYCAFIIHFLFEKSYSKSMQKT